MSDKNTETTARGSFENDGKIKQAISYIRHEDDETYDEINIKLVERWKTSELSGDEWRFSAVIEFKRKGHVLREERFSKMEWAVAALPYLLMSLGEQGKLDQKALDRTRMLCAQPGCPNVPVHEYKLKKRYCRDGHPSEAETPFCQFRIRFCDKHKHRGDCGMQDADDNYIPVDLPQKSEAPPEPEKIPASEKLAKAMALAGCPRKTIGRALHGYYDDFKSILPFPRIKLVQDLAAFPELQERAKNGEFDAEKWEAERKLGAILRKVRPPSREL